MIKKPSCFAVAIIILVLMAAGCTTQTSTLKEETIAPAQTDVETAETAVPLQVPTLTPIVTTQPEPEPMPTAVITVKEGDTLERDILPQLTQAFEISQDEAKQVLAACPDSFLIGGETEGFRRMEGVVLPGQYEVYAGDKLEQHVINWVRQSEQRYEDIAAGLENPNELEPYERLILASIVEWECIANEYQHETASVFLNRLDRGMKLQSCVTSEYAIGFQRPFLYTDDIKVESPYNTYYIKGLPIGPICTPDDESMRAASAASKDNSLFFFFYNYAEDEMFFFAEYEDFKREGLASRELFESVFAIDPHEVIDKRKVFG